MSKLNIIINTSFSAIHCWPECPIEEVSFLRNPHRHIFHIKIKVPVNHTDRDIEFIQFKNALNKYIQDAFEGRNLGHMSCEDMCMHFSNRYPNITYISVMEDNENGAELLKR